MSHEEDGELEREHTHDFDLPKTRTLAGGTFPAAVICPAKNLGNSSAASMTARYPAILACEERTSYV